MLSPRVFPCVTSLVFCALPWTIAAGPTSAIGNSIAPLRMPLSAAHHIVNALSLANSDQHRAC